MQGLNQDALPPQSEAVTLFSLLQMIADPEKTKQQLTVWLETKQSVEKAQTALEQQRKNLEKLIEDVSLQKSNLAAAQDKLRFDQKAHDERVVAVAAREVDVAARSAKLADYSAKLGTMDQNLRAKEDALNEVAKTMEDRKRGLDNRALDLDAAEKAHAERVSKLKALIA